MPTLIPKKNGAYDFVMEMRHPEGDDMLYDECDLEMTADEVMELVDELLADLEKYQPMTVDERLASYSAERKARIDAFKSGMVYGKK